MPKFFKKLRYQEIFVIMRHTRRVALERRCVEGSKIVEKVYNYRFLTAKAGDAA